MNILVEANPISELVNQQQQQQYFYFTPKLLQELLKNIYIYIQQMIGVLVARNNLKVKNAR